MKKTILLMILVALICVSMVMATTPVQVAGKPSIYDNWDTSVYENGTVVFYRFDNESTVGANDTNVFDWSGAGNNGTINGAVYNLTNKQLGDGAMEFDGINDYIGLDSTVKLKNVTFSFWFNSQNINVETNFFANDSFSSFSRVGFTYVSPSRSFIFLETDTNGDEVSTELSTNFENNTWYHIAISRNENSASMYVNSVNESEPGETFSTNDFISISRISSISDRFFKGTMDEVMIFNRSLSSSEIQDIYNQTNKNQLIAYENMSLISSATLLEKNYLLNDAGGDGSIQFGDDDIIFDCNGASLVGNRNAGSNGIFIASFDNITVKNCNITGYQDAGIRIRPDADNNLIINNTFIDMAKGTYVHFSNSNNSIISNTYINATADFSAVDGVLIENNSFDLLNLKIGITIRTGSSGFIIKNNSISNSLYMFIQITGNSQNILIDENIMQNSDIGIDFRDSSNINITNNTLINLTSLSDDYASGMVLSNISNVRAISNIINYGSAGILIRQSINITIDKNTFQQVSISDKIGSSKSDKFEATCAICALQKYKGFFDNSPNPSVNLTISGNTFDANVQSFLRLQGTTNINNDLSSYWFRKFNISGYSNETEADEFYNNNLFDRLSNVRPTSFTENFIFFKSGIETSGASTNTVNNYSISKTLLEFVNTNDTINEELKLFNLSLADPYNDIKNITSGTILATNQDNYTVTIAPNQEIQVGNFEPPTPPTPDEQRDTTITGFIAAFVVIASFYSIITLLIITKVILLVVRKEKDYAKKIKELIPALTVTISNAILVILAIIILAIMGTSI